MVKAKKEEEVQEEVVDSSAVFQVFDSKGDFVRDYSVEASGKDAKELAETFAREINGSVK